MGWSDPAKAGWAADHLYDCLCLSREHKAAIAEDLSCAISASHHEEYLIQVQRILQAESHQQMEKIVATALQYSKISTLRKLCLFSLCTLNEKKDCSLLPTMELLLTEQQPEFRYELAAILSLRYRETSLSNETYPEELRYLDQALRIL